CGPGSLLLDLASTYTKSSFFGLDLNPLFPTHIKPPNVSFYEHDILDGLPFDGEKFDFVYLRFMKDFFVEEAWKYKVLPEVLRVLKPGGWIEFMELDRKFYDIGPITSDFTQMWLDVKQYHYIYMSVPKFQEIIQSFQPQLMSITTEEKINYWYPISSPESQNTVDIAKELMRFTKARILNSTAMDNLEFEALADKVTAEIKEYKSYGKTYRIYAQKKAHN
ncbi:17635_t:CDS:2, partial [Acaulospora morrowiae]